MTHTEAEYIQAGYRYEAAATLAAARELQYDYTPTEIDGVTFWYR